MLRLAICDDEARCRERIASLIAEYGRARGCALSAESFSGAAQLLDSGGRFDIYLLDILMQNTTAICAQNANRRVRPQRNANAETRYRHSTRNTSASSST